MLYETPCNPVPAADVDGFNFFRDQDGTIIARCVRCRIRLTVTDENAERVGCAMTIHLDVVCGVEPLRAVAPPSTAGTVR